MYECKLALVSFSRSSLLSDCYVWLCETWGERELCWVLCWGVVDKVDGDCDGDDDDDDDCNKACRGRWLRPRGWDLTWQGNWSQSRVTKFGHKFCDQFRRRRGISQIQLKSRDQKNDQDWPPKLGNRCVPIVQREIQLIWLFKSRSSYK